VLHVWIDRLRWLTERASRRYKRDEWGRFAVRQTTRRALPHPSRLGGLPSALTGGWEMDVATAFDINHEPLLDLAQTFARRLGGSQARGVNDLYVAPSDELAANTVAAYYADDGSIGIQEGQAERIRAALDSGEYSDLATHDCFQTLAHELSHAAGHDDLWEPLTALRKPYRALEEALAEVCGHETVGDLVEALGVRVRGEAAEELAKPKFRNTSEGVALNSTAFAYRSWVRQFARIAAFSLPKTASAEEVSRKVFEGAKAVRRLAGKDQYPFLARKLLGSSDAPERVVRRLARDLKDFMVNREPLALLDQRVAEAREMLG